MAILERPVEDRWKSFSFAQQAGDWNWKGEAAHKEALAAYLVPDVSPDFRAEHEEWFSMVRGYAESHQQRFPVLDLSFDEVTRNPANKTQAVVTKQIMNWRLSMTTN